MPQGKENERNAAQSRRIFLKNISEEPFSNNQAIWTAPELPFGSVKNSGYRRELSDLGPGEFVTKKLIRAA